MLTRDLYLINHSKSPFVKKFAEPLPTREISIVAHTTFTKEKLIDSLQKSILSSILEHFVDKNRYIRVKWR